MNFMDRVRNRILKFLRIDKINGNPYAQRLTFIGDEQNIIEQQLKEYDAWYSGDSSELLNFYTNQELFDMAKEPIYNRNRQNYYWAISTGEENIKRVHSGVPNAIITTLVNVIGSPKIEITDETIDVETQKKVMSVNDEANNRLQEILEKNDFINMLNQQQMPLTMVQGWGAFKVNFDKNLCDYPIIQYYDAHDVEFIYKSGILLGIIYKDYYQHNGKKYVLVETRRKLNGSSVIEYELFRLSNRNDAIPCELNEVPELEGLQNIEIPNYNRILGVPSKFLYDKFNKNYGRSMYAGKIDLFDDLDQNLSQNSQTTRVSTPNEYIPVDMLERDRNGNPIMPKTFNRMWIKTDASPNGDGTIANNEIVTTQPQLNFEQYNDNEKHILLMILIGLLAPATMGFDIAKKDNADAQREKEKTTIMTRNNVIDRETKILKDLSQIVLDIDEYMRTGKITLQNHSVSVKFDEFANPSFENELQILGNAWSNGQISTDKYVDLLWHDKLSEEDKQKQIEWLDNNRQQDNLMMGDFEPNTPTENEDLM